MARIEISESSYLKTSKDNDDNEIGQIYESKGYSKIPIDQINGCQSLLPIYNFRPFTYR